MKLVRKHIAVDIAYFVGTDEPTRGIFRGGVQEPAHLDGLVIDTIVDDIYDESSDTFQTSGKTQLNVYGTRESYRALAQCLLSMCELETKDPGYHFHVEGIRGSDGSEAAHLILHLPWNEDNSVSTVAPLDMR